MKSVYLIGSLRNPEVPRLGNRLRALGFDVFEDWVAAGPEADEKWREYEIAKGHSYSQALKGYAARHVYEYDRFHLDRCDMAVLVLPAGKSGHLELGYFVGSGKPGYILLDAEYDRWDIMLLFATGIFDKEAELVAALQATEGKAGYSS